MKRKKLQPAAGTRIVLIESYVKSKAYNFDAIHSTIYYVDTKRRVIWQEDGINVTNIMKMKKMPVEPGVEYYESWTSRQRPRSLNALIAKYDSDFNRFKNVFYSYSLNITELGVL